VSLFRLNKTLRIVRILRLLRLLRVLKGLNLVSDLSDKIQSEEVQTYLNISQFLFGIVLLNHYIACCWYGVGASQVTEDMDPRESWVTRLHISRSRDADFSYLYTTALHWSLTQFTPASVEVVPANAVERTFTIGVVMLAVLLFSSLLSSITTSMINLRKLSEEKTKQAGYVRRYITDKQVTLETGNRVVAYLRKHNYNVSSKKSLHEDQIRAFAILPDSLLAQLRCEVYLPQLLRHPFFRLARKLDEAALVPLCVSAMVEQTLSLSQERFACGERATHMYITTSDSFAFFLGQLEEISEPVPAGAIVSEPALWVVWEHRGRLVALAPANLMAMRAEAFQKVMVESVSHTLCRAYAQRLRRQLMEWDMEFSEILTDIRVVDQEMLEVVRRAYDDWKAIDIDCSPDLSGALSLASSQDVAPGERGGEGRPSAIRRSLQRSVLGDVVRRVIAAMHR